MLFEQRFLDRYLDRVIVTPGCWDWDGAKNDHGYGQLRLTDGIIYIHRFMYQIVFGPIPDDVVVRHRCDNPPCSNPDHLKIGSQVDNAEDARSRGRLAVGERLPQAKMTAENVVEARDLWRGGLDVYTIAKRFGVTRVTMREALIGKTWKHLPDPISDEERKVRNGR